MKLPHPFNSSCTQPNSSSTYSSYWPYCSQSPRTLSFRSIRFEEESSNSIVCSAEAPKCSVAIVEEYLDDEGAGETMETVISGLKSADRLFFEPDETNSILGEAKKASKSNVETSVTLLTVDSMDPYLDFKQSMEEMVEEANGAMGWEWLQELLECYLRVNMKSNHGFIIAAFVDLLVSLDLEALRCCCPSLVTSSHITFSSSSDYEISTSCCSSSTLPTEAVIALEDDQDLSVG